MFISGYRPMFMKLERLYFVDRARLLKKNIVFCTLVQHYFY